MLMLELKEGETNVLLITLFELLWYPLRPAIPSLIIDLIMIPWDSGLGFFCLVVAINPAGGGPRKFAAKG